MPEIHFQEGKLHYHSRGSGPRDVILIHGFGEDSRIWDEFSSSLIDKDIHILTPDLPGFAGSASLSPSSMDQMADAVYACIQDAQLEQFVVIGHSMGGYAALNLARRYPDSGLIGLGLFHSHPYADSEEKKEGRTKTAGFIQVNGTPKFATSFVPKMFSDEFRVDNPQIVEKLVEICSMYSEKAMAEAMLAMRDRIDETETLVKSRVPALFILGKEDQLADFEAIYPQVLLPNSAQIHLMDGVGHMGMYEAKALCQQAVESFVEMCYLFAGEN